MRLLFSGVPALGHLLPVFPFVRATEAVGHDVAVLTINAERAAAAGAAEVVHDPALVGDAIKEVARDRDCIDAARRVRAQIEQRQTPSDALQELLVRAASALQFYLMWSAAARSAAMVVEPPGYPSARGLVSRSGS